MSTDIPDLIAGALGVSRGTAYDMMREALAKQYAEKNSLGGPAKVFDAMADAIRTGDDYHAVLRQYGFVEAQKQEPVAFIRSDRHGDVALEWDKDEDLEGGLYSYEPLYTSPPASKPWVGLTKEDRYKAIRPLYRDDESAALAVCHSNDEYEAIEAKLREKNA